MKITTGGNLQTTYIFFQKYFISIIIKYEYLCNMVHITLSGRINEVER